MRPARRRRTAVVTPRRHPGTRVPPRIHSRQHDPISVPSGARTAAPGSGHPPPAPARRTRPVRHGAAAVEPASRDAAGPHHLRAVGGRHGVRRRRRPGRSPCWPAAPRVAGVVCTIASLGDHPRLLITLAGFCVATLLGLAFVTRGLTEADRPALGLMTVAAVAGLASLLGVAAVAALTLLIAARGRRRRGRSCSTGAEGADPCTRWTSAAIPPSTPARAPHWVNVASRLAARCPQLAPPATVRWSARPVAGLDRATPWLWGPADRDPLLGPGGPADTAPPAAELRRIVAAGARFDAVGVAHELDPDGPVRPLLPLLADGPRTCSDEVARELVGPVRRAPGPPGCSTGSWAGRPRGGSPARSTRSSTRSSSASSRRGRSPTACRACGSRWWPGGGDGAAARPPRVASRPGPAAALGTGWDRCDGRGVDDRRRRLARPGRPGSPR